MGLLQCVPDGRIGAISPVPGTSSRSVAPDNVTYPNECSLCREIFRNRVIDKKHDGKCIKVDCTGYMRTTGGRESLCTRHYNPLCATNGVTYSNKCSFCTAVANGEDIDLLMPGKCPKFRNTQIDCSGFKSSGFKDNVFCTAEYMPLCGSDGRTYGNKCHFCIAVQKSRGSLTLKHHGEC
uniref:Ovomucoid n=1 Tax=Anas platyrhynchos TaxID=8839 RepID=A0A8B9T5F7_ANAPL